MSQRGIFNIKGVVFNRRPLFYCGKEGGMLRSIYQKCMRVQNDSHLI